MKALKFEIAIAFALLLSGATAQAQSETAVNQAEDTVNKAEGTVNQAEGSKENKVDNQVKELSGISIIGNKEAPKSLYIVPWKSSEVGVESELVSSLMDDKLKPLDKEVFMRELEFYELSLSGD